MEKVLQLNRRLYPSIFDSEYYALTRLHSSIVKTIQKHLQAKKEVAIFDYGCGDVPYKQLFDDIANRYVAGDIAGNPNADVVLDRSGRAPCQDETFDVILSCQSKSWNMYRMSMPI